MWEKLKLTVEAKKASVQPLQVETPPPHERRTLVSKLLSLSLQGIQELISKESASIDFSEKNLEPSFQDKYSNVTLKELFYSIHKCFAKQIHKKNIESINKTKKMQLIIDAFRLKLTACLQKDFKCSRSEARELACLTSIEIKEEALNCIAIQQVIRSKEGLGSHIIFRVDFKHKEGFGVPTLTKISSTKHFLHTGFPSPSEYIGWALPLTFLYEESSLVKRERENFILSFQNESAYRAKCELLCHIKRQVFNEKKDFFVSLHQTLCQKLLEEPVEKIAPFYQVVQQASSPFDLLIETQQRIFFIFKLDGKDSLEEVWMQSIKADSQACITHHIDAFVKKMENIQEKMLLNLRMSCPIEAYIALLGAFLHKVHYRLFLFCKLKENSFALSSKEHLLRDMAYKQLLFFLEEKKNSSTDKKIIESRLIQKYLEEIAYFN